MLGWGGFSVRRDSSSRPPARAPEDDVERVSRVVGPRVGEVGGEQLGQGNGGAVSDRARSEAALITSAGTSSVAARHRSPGHRRARELPPSQSPHSGASSASSSGTTPRGAGWSGSTRPAGRDRPDLGRRDPDQLLVHRLIDRARMVEHDDPLERALRRGSCAAGRRGLPRSGAHHLGVSYRLQDVSETVRRPARIAGRGGDDAAATWRSGENLPITPRRRIDTVIRTFLSRAWPRPGSLLRR